jgi:hypothetical protein
MKEFVKLDKYGQLYIDKILFESYFPIIFTCINDNSEIFICVCCQNNEKGCKWLIGKTNGASIVRMLRDEITIRQLLLEYSSGKISVDYVENEFTVAYNNSDWNEGSLYLPKEDSYMYAEDGEFEDEITYFSSVSHVCYGAEYYKRISEVLGTVSKEIEPITEPLTAFTSAIGNITIKSEVISTLKVHCELGPNLTINTEKYMNQDKYKSVFDGILSESPEGISIEIGVDGNNYADAA